MFFFHLRNNEKKISNYSCTIEELESNQIKEKKIRFESLIDRSLIMVETKKKRNECEMNQIGKKKIEENALSKRGKKRIIIIIN